MSELRIGVDLDGVLCNFNHAFQKRVIAVTGEDKFRGDDFNQIDPPCWDYVRQHYGYSQGQNRAVWDSVIEDPSFWSSLRPYGWATRDLTELAAIRAAGHQVYFITTRAGVAPQLQSLYWLQALGYPMASVLIARSHDAKGFIAKGLNLTHFIDDKPENCQAVKSYAPECRVVLLHRSYNTHWHGHAVERQIGVVTSVNEFLKELPAYAQA